MADGSAPEGPGADRSGLAQCQLTGKWVQPDETIELRGYRVCAAGKEMLLRSLRSGEPISAGAVHPTYLLRFGCWFLDNIFLLAVSLLVFYLAGVNLPQLLGLDDPNPLNQARWGIGVRTIAIFYYAIFHAWRGQTPGKMAGRIQVVSLEGKPVTAKQAFLRSGFLVGPDLVLVLLLLLAGFAGMKLPTIIRLHYVGGAISAAILLISVLLALTDRRLQRALHDRLAGTRVIQAGGGT